MFSPYSVLGVADGSDLREVKLAYRKMVLEHHPDKGGDMETFIKIQQAYDFFTNDFFTNDFLTNEYLKGMYDILGFQQCRVRMGIIKRLEQSPEFYKSYILSHANDFDEIILDGYSKNNFIDDLTNERYDKVFYLFTKSESKDDAHYARSMSKIMRIYNTNLRILEIAKFLVFKVTKAIKIAKYICLGGIAVGSLYISYKMYSNMLSGPSNTINS